MNIFHSKISDTLKNYCFNESDFNSENLKKNSNKNPHLNKEILAGSNNNPTKKSVFCMGSLNKKPPKAIEINNKSGSEKSSILKK